MKCFVLNFVLSLVCFALPLTLTSAFSGVDDDCTGSTACSPMEEIVGAVCKMTLPFNGICDCLGSEPATCGLGTIPAIIGEVKPMAAVPAKLDGGSCHTPGTVVSPKLLDCGDPRVVHQWDLFDAAGCDGPIVTSVIYKYYSTVDFCAGRSCDCEGGN